MGVNMSYCRFVNTNMALEECLDNMEKKLSVREARERARLIELCQEIAERFGDFDFTSIQESDEEDEE